MERPLLGMIEHLRARGLNVDLYEGIGWDDERATIPLRTLDGKFAGVLRHNPAGDKKSKTTPKYRMVNCKGRTVFFGVESIANDGPIYLVEGVFKAAKLHNLGFASLAIMGADVKHHRGQLKILRQTRPLIAIGDNDVAGKAMVKQVGAGFTSPRDLDEMTDEEVLWLLKS